MTASSRRQIVLAGLGMAAFSAAALKLEPRRKLSDQRSRKVHLDSVVPKRFTAWEVDPSAAIAVVNAQQQAVLDLLYSQTLERLYVRRADGVRVMLSIAYGEDQRKGLSVHYPEVCYPAQGFMLTANSRGELALPSHVLPVKLLVATQGLSRVETISYWTTVGAIVTLGGLPKRIAEIKYGKDGLIPDGLIFRVSTVGLETEIARSVHEAFVRDLWSELDPVDRELLFGKASRG